MGKKPRRLPPIQRQPAPISPESPRVQQAGQKTAEELAKKRGRGAMFFANPAMRAGYSGGIVPPQGGYRKKTGEV